MVYFQRESTWVNPVSEETTVDVNTSLIQRESAVQQSDFMIPEFQSSAAFSALLKGPSDAQRFSDNQRSPLPSGGERERESVKEGEAGKHPNVFLRQR